MYVIFFRLRSDHNEDSSPEIINTWLSEWARYYHIVDSEINSSPPYHLPGELGSAHWPHSRYSHIINLREQALVAAQQSWADYIWVGYILFLKANSKLAYVHYVVINTGPYIMCIPSHFIDKMLL